MTTLTRAHFLQAIAAAERDGFAHYAEALKRLYAQQYPPESSADHATQRRRQAVKDSHNPWDIT